MRKVLHVLWAGKSGGAERFVQDICSYSLKSDFEHVVVFLSDGGWISDNIRKSGNRIYILGMVSGSSIMRVLRLIKIISLERPDVILSHVRNYIANIIILLFAYGKKKIYFEHGGALLSNDPRKEIKFYNTLGRFYNIILANSNFVVNKIVTMTRVKSAKVKLFYMGIDERKYDIVRDESLKKQLGVPEGSFVIGIIARLVEGKGIDDFIRVISKVEELNIGIPISCLIVGEGELSNNLVFLKNQFRLNNIIFTGDRCDVPKILSILDLYLFTSKWEPFGIILLEAMAAHVPVIGFSVSGAKEIFEKGDLNECLVDNRDYCELANMVMKMMSNPEFVSNIRKKELDNVRNWFSLDKNLRELENQYLRAL